MKKILLDKYNKKHRAGNDHFSENFMKHKNHKQKQEKKNITTTSISTST